MLAVTVFTKNQQQNQGPPYQELPWIDPRGQSPGPNTYAITSAKGTCSTCEWLLIGTCVISLQVVKSVRAVVTTCMYH